MDRSKSMSNGVNAAILGAGLIIAAVCTSLFPEVKGLGGKVRLPVFHGAMTWVNLAAFTLLALSAVAFLITKRDVFYRYAEALRWVSVPMWLLGTGMGTYAAYTTWDFSGSRLSPLGVLNELMIDPRLKAQIWILFGALILIALELLLGERTWTAVLDVAFVGALWALLLTAILGPGRAFHPDSPVMNSDEIIIKLYFFGIVLGIGLVVLAAVRMLAALRMQRDTYQAEPAEGE